MKNQDNPNFLNKGIDKDSSLPGKSESALEFSLNATSNGFEGNKMRYQTEPGNEECFTLPDNYIVIGRIYMSDNEQVIFSTDNISSEIGIVKNCKYTTVVNNECLNFKTTNPITGKFRIVNGCERKIYWRDSLNSDRHLNIDKWIRDSACEEFDCNALSFNPKVVEPCIDLVSVNNSGGSLFLGSYFFQVEVLDENLNLIYRSDLSKPVTIVNESYADSYPIIDGGLNIETYPNEGVPKTNKSITLNVSNLDTSFAYIRFNVRYYATGDGVTSTSHTVNALIPITDSSIDFTYVGYLPDANGDYPIDNDATVTSKVILDRSSAFEQVQGRLLRANLSEPYFDPAELQKVASRVWVEWIIEPVDANSADEKGNPKSPDTYWLDTSFMDDEIYSFGVAFDLDNGYKTPVFHIPGTPINTIIVDGECIPLSGYKNYIYKEKCVKLKGLIEVNDPHDCDVVISYNIKFDLNGDPQSIDGVIPIFLSGEDIPIDETVFCTAIPEDISNVKFTYTYVTGNCPNDFDLTLNWEIAVNSIQKDIPQDDEIISVWNKDLLAFTDLTATQYNALPANQKFKRWQIYNTAIVNEEFTAGRMGYVECSSAVYEPPQSCCIDNYWGNDYCGNPLEGTPIRHHRMPCRSIIGTSKISNFRKNIKLGVRFHNLEYIDSRIVGHSFFVGERTENNKTVLDQGFAGSLGKDNEYTAFSFFQPNFGTITPGKGIPNCTSSLEHDTERLWYFSPKTHLGKEYLNPSYIKIIETVSTSSVRTEVLEVDEIDGSVSNSTDVFCGARVKCYTGTVENTGTTFYPVYSNKIIDPYAEITEGTFKFANLSRTNKIGLLKSINVPKMSNHQILHISFKVNREVFCNLDAIRYKKMHTCNYTINDDNSYDVYGGDTVVAKFDVWNDFLLKVNDNYLKAIGIIIALIVVAVAGLVSGGAALIALPGIATALQATIIAYAAIVGAGVASYKAIEKANFNFFKGLYKNFLCDEVVNDRLDNIDEYLEDYVVTMSEYMRNIYLASEVNSELRHGTTEVCYNYFQGEDSEVCGNNASDEDLYFYIKDRLLYYNEGDKQIKVKEIFCPEYYGYNKDYSKYYSDKYYFSIPKTFDFCRKCGGTFHNTIIYSEKSFDNEMVDNYLVYLINSSKDISANRGEITGLKYKNNILYVHTKESTFILQPNPQTIQTDSNVAYLGTGDFLSLPPNEIIETDTGFAGSQSLLAYSDSEHGYIWVDQSKGDVNLILKGMEEISSIAMDSWFTENLPSVLAEKFLESTGEEFPHLDAPSHEYGTGIISIIDPKHKRIIIHKKDFEPLREVSTDLDDLLSNKLVWFNGRFLANAKGDYTKIVKFGDKEYFANKSWTISYSLTDKQWVSYHSYMPDFFLNDRNFFYSTDGNKVFKHLHNNNYCQFYGVKYPFIVSGIQNTLATSQLHSLIYISTSEVFNQIKKTFELKPEITFNKGYFYNSDETSGLLNLQYLNLHENPYGNILLPENTKSIIYTDENYKISGIRDVSTGSPVISKDWNDIQDFFNINGSKHGYIDIVPINYDHTKDVYTLKNLDDKYMVYRLIYEPSIDDVRLSVTLTINRMFQSIR